MPAAASNSLGGRFWGKLAVFWRFAKNTRALLSIPACSSHSLLFASIFARIFTVLSFFDPVRACAFCPNMHLSLCAICTFKEVKTHENRTGGAVLSGAGKIGQRALPEALPGEVPAGGKTAVLQKRSGKAEPGEQGVGGVAVAGDAHPRFSAAHLL